MFNPKTETAKSYKRLSDKDESSQDEESLLSSSETHRRDLEVVEVPTWRTPRWLKFCLVASCLFNAVQTAFYFRILSHEETVADNARSHHADSPLPTGLLYCEFYHPFLKPVCILQPGLTKIQKHPPSTS